MRYSASCDNTGNISKSAWPFPRRIFEDHMLIRTSAVETLPQEFGWLPTAPCIFEHRCSLLRVPQIWPIASKHGLTQRAMFHRTKHCSCVLPGCAVWTGCLRPKAPTKVINVNILNNDGERALQRQRLFAATPSCCTPNLTASGFGTSLLHG